MSKLRRVGIMLDLDSSYKRHTSLFAGTQDYAQRQDWETTIDEYADDTLSLRRAPSPPFDGVIARATKKLAQRAGRLRVPVVNVWLNSPVADELPGVFPDYAAAGQLCAEHLLVRGLQRFARLTTSTVSHQLETKAFRTALAEAGSECKIAKAFLSTASTLSQWRKTEHVVAAWMDDWQPPIGVYVASEPLGRLVAQMCRSRGLQVPADVAIIAGWNEETLCQQPHPSLTSVEMGYERVGFEAARLLDMLMRGKVPPQRTILLPPQGLVVRESTDFHAVDDEIVAAALAFIAANSHLPIGRSDVAKAVGVELRTLQNRFRKHLDRPIATEIRRVRIERAKRELAQSKRSMAEIARAAGFGPPMRMYEVFRRELGVTPSEYRKQRQVQIG